MCIDTVWADKGGSIIPIIIPIIIVNTNFISKENVEDSVVIRIPKAYPAYFGTFDKFDNVKEYLDHFDNLFLIGRNGMHRYNNMDHSMLSAMEAVNNIINGKTDNSNIWAVNSEKNYHESIEDDKK